MVVALAFSYVRGTRRREEGAMSGRRQVIALFAIGALTLGVVILTALEPAWIEALAGIDPDGGSGKVEWVVVLVLAAVGLLAGYIGVRRLRTRGRSPGVAAHSHSSEDV